MKALIITILLLLNNTLIKAQNLPIPDSVWSLEQLTYPSVYLSQPIGNNQSRGGSGTIIAHAGKFYILTASHVAEFMESTGIIVFKEQGDIPFEIKLGSLKKNLTDTWVHHPIADLAILEISATKADILQRLTNWSIKSNCIVQTKEIPPYDIDIDFIGYPVVHAIPGHFSPIIQTTTKASGLITAKWKSKNGDKYCDFFALGKPGMQGGSGGGVFVGVDKMTRLGDKTLLVGIISLTFSDTTGGKLCGVIPIYYLWDILAK